MDKNVDWFLPARHPLLKGIGFFNPKDLVVKPIAPDIQGQASKLIASLFVLL
jgi:hypothetical protein